MTFSWTSRVAMVALVFSFVLGGAVQATQSQVITQNPNKVAPPPAKTSFEQTPSAGVSDYEMQPFTLGVFNVTWQMTCNHQALTDAVWKNAKTSQVIVPQVPLNDHTHFFSDMPPHEDRYAFDIATVDPCKSALTLKFKIRNINLLQKTFLVEVERDNKPAQYLPGFFGQTLAVEFDTMTGVDTGKAGVVIQVQTAFSKTYPNLKAMEDKMGEINSRFHQGLNSDESNF